MATWTFISMIFIVTDLNKTIFFIISIVVLPIKHIDSTAVIKGTSAIDSYDKACTAQIVPG